MMRLSISRGYSPGPLGRPPQSHVSINLTFWISLRSSAGFRARSKYSLSEIEAIFWNEVAPAVGFDTIGE
jgi:hypothetical protein